MGYTVGPLSPELSFGKVVSGLQPSDIEQEAMREDLRHLWIQDGLIVFRDGDVTDEFQLDLSRIFGPLEPHPVKELQSDKNPDLITLVSDATKGGICEVDDVPVIAYTPWHMDLVFMPSINHGGILRALQISSEGGKTGFIDRIVAYDMLPDTLKREIEGLNIVYQLCVDIPSARYRDTERLRTIVQGTTAARVQARIELDYPPVVHPITFNQPETGRKVLTVSPLHALYIEGHDTPEGHELLSRLVKHVRSCPAYHHSWTPSEMLLWDNWRMLHSVSGAPVDEVRIMQRTTIAGDYALGRRLEPAMA